MTTPLCSCGIPMKEKTNKVTRQKFYGCAKFSKGGCGETGVFYQEPKPDLSECRSCGAKIGMNWTKIGGHKFCPKCCPD